MSYSAFSRFYDSLTENVMYENRADYYHGLLVSNRVPNGILLDLGCGTGSMSVLMAKRGYSVIGADISVDMLSKAREKAANAGENILFINQDMLELDLYGTVFATICTLDTLNHLGSLEELRAVFEKVSLFTEQGGLFAFDVNTVYKHREVLADNTFVYETDDVFCVWQNSLNDDDSVDISLDFFEKNGEMYERTTEDFTECAWPLADIKAQLEGAGFEVIGIYSDLTLNDAAETDERAVFAARKK